MVMFLLLAETIVLGIIGRDIFQLFKSIIVDLHIEKTWKYSSLSWIVLDYNYIIGTIIDYRKFDFSSCVGKNLSFEAQDLADCNFFDVTLLDVNFTALYCDNSNFAESKLINVKFDDIDLSRVDFSDSLMEKVIFNRVDFLENNFTRAVLDRCLFAGIELRVGGGILFKKVNLDKVRFIDCVFNSVIFIEITFTIICECGFPNDCNCTCTKFTRCKFINCKFKNCVIDKIEMSDCVFEEKTIVLDTYFPEDICIKYPKLYYR